MILIGTSKGLIVFEKKKIWIVKDVHFLGMPVSYVYVDERNGNWWVSLAHRHWGQKLHYSSNQGEDWQSVAPPKYPATAMRTKDQVATLKKIWCMAHGGKDRPNDLWLGTEPGGLFYSDDYGQTFNLVNALWNHPSRLDENQWFGAGRDFPFIHSIVVNPNDSDHIYIAVSCAGVFETKDRGKTWAVKNKGLVASYLPNPDVEVGHDPHLLLQCQNHPEVLWQQNHCGIFRSTNGGALWEIVTDKNGLADYGFGLAIDPDDPLKAWVIPATSDEIRVAKDLALCVCQTVDGGKNWTALRNGLPQNNTFDLVLRHAFAKVGDLMVFGSTTGNLYLSEDEGKSWECLSGNLARVDCLTISS